MYRIQTLLCAAASCVGTPFFDLIDKSRVDRRAICVGKRPGIDTEIRLSLTSSPALPQELSSTEVKVNDSVAFCSAKRYDFYLGTFL